MITLKLTFNTIEEALVFLQPKINATAPVSAGPDKGSPSVEGDKDKVLTSMPAAVAPITPAPAPKNKPGRPRKPAAAAAAAGPTEADVRAALMKVNDKFGASGLAKVAEVIKPFGVTRVGELKPVQYLEVIAAADGALA
ncbi:MAG: hypothetical protein Q8R92_16845 [Deltaproteobacteria bacterium]|nr:hypothetical protein [Deltaproteobacteria bacterium]